MRTLLKSIVYVVEEHLDTERLIHNEIEGEFSGPEVKKDSQSDKASNYDDYQEPYELSQNDNDRLIPKSDRRISFSEFENCNESTCSGLENTETNLYSFVGEKHKVLLNTQMFLPDTKSSFGDIKCWHLLLRCARISGIGKFWRPVFVKLEGGAIAFHAEDFESSPPFKIINLTWFYSFSKPGIKTKLIRNEFLFNCLLVDAFCATHTRVRLAKTRSKVVKFGCANYSVLLHFMETVQKCVHSFPAFRTAGIFYKTEMVTIRVHDIYDVIQQKIAQQERHASTQIDQRENVCNCGSKQVEIMLKAKVSASPNCTIYVRHAEMFSKQPAIDEVRFHKCVKSHFPNNQTITVRFVPLDNCWLQLMSWKGACSKPAPLRCEVTVTVCAKSCVQIQACLFTTSTRLEVTSARNLTISCYIPSEWFETQRMPAAEIVQQCTDVTRGSVSYSSEVETMLWHIPKLSFTPYRHFFLTGKPLATLNTMLKPPSYCYFEKIVKIPVQMSFYTISSARLSEVTITGMKLDLKLFEKLKCCFTSMYRIQIPVSFVIK